MNRGSMGTPTGGVPIPYYLYEQYSDDLKAAWETFHVWWKEAELDEDGLVPASSMPKNVKMAMDLICETLIPGYENATGTDSCYMVGVKNRMKGFDKPVN